MTPRQNRRRLWRLTPVAVVAIGLVIALIALRPSGTPLNLSARSTALLGYLALFLSIVSSAFARQLYRPFEQPFIRIHHTLAVAGLILLTLHPLSVMLDWQDPQVLLPKFSSWAAFLQWGGSPAWILIVLGSLTALLRKPIGRNWRLIHLLTYVAFTLGTLHATRIGTDFQCVGMQGVALALLLLVSLTFIRKRRRRAT